MCPAVSTTYPLPSMFPTERQFMADIEHRHTALRIVRELSCAWMEQLLIAAKRNVQIAVSRHRQRIICARCHAARFRFSADNVQT